MKQSRAGSNWLPASVLWVTLLSIAMSAHADPPGDAERGEKKTPARPHALQVLAEARNKGKAPPPQASSANAPNANGQPIRAFGSTAPVELELRAGNTAALGAMQAAADRAKREQVRRTRQRELRAKLKVQTVPPRVRAELRNHARRISRLQRIRVLASEDAALVARVDALIAKEKAHHDRRIAMLVLAGLAAEPAAREGSLEGTADQDDEAEE